VTTAPLYREEINPALTHRSTSVATHDSGCNAL
jgi:hypothetical protein